VSRLIIDARWLYTGIGAYTLNLIRGLHDCGVLPVTLITLPEHRAKLAPFGYELVFSNARLYSLREQIDVARAARDFDVLHVPHYNAPVRRRKTLLVTIHDLTHLLDQTMGRTLRSRVYAKPMLRHIAQRADRIFTVSQYSKDRIVEHLGADASKITITCNAVPPHIYPEPRDESRALINQAFAFSGNYLLFVGNLKPHKNVAGLLKAFAIVRQRGKIDHKLLIIGDDSHGRTALAREVADLKLTGDVIFAGRASDDEVRRAYSGADLTIMPSFEEGFGLPVIESMACGTPVACSNAASLPEGGGEAAEYFDPADIESMASAIESVLLSQDRWRELQTWGFAQAAKFDGRDFAGRHITVYREFLSAS
jgi:glycosyltransferase involved in cell wall biosynthesis